MATIIRGRQQRASLLSDGYVLKGIKTLQQAAEQFKALGEAQGWKCAICNTKSTTTGKVRSLKPDSSKTGEVRGLLCPDCLEIVKRSKHSSALLRKAAEYLHSF